MREDRNSIDDIFAHLLIRNVLMGVVFMFGVSAAMCLPAVSVTMAAGIAILPAVFAGPFVGGLATMVMITRRAETIEATSATAASPAA